MRMRDALLLQGVACAALRPSKSGLCLSCDQVGRNPVTSVGHSPIFPCLWLLCALRHSLSCSCVCCAVRDLQPVLGHALLQGGILAADKVLTVSPNYATEISADAAGGVELDTFLRWGGLS